MGSGKRSAKRSERSSPRWLNCSGEGRYAADGMRLLLIAVLAVVAFVLVSCGSSGVSESDAQALLESHTSLTSPECVRSSTGSDRDFDCTAMGEGNPVTIEATVGESGESVVVTHCDDQGSIYKPCEAVNQR